MAKTKAKTFTNYILVSEDDKFIIQPGGIIDITDITIGYSMHHSKKVFETQLDMIKKNAAEKGSKSDFAKKQLKMKPKIKNVIISIE